MRDSDAQPPHVQCFSSHCPLHLVLVHANTPCKSAFWADAVRIAYAAHGITDAHLHQSRQPATLAAVVAGARAGSHARAIDASCARLQAAAPRGWHVGPHPCSGEITRTRAVNILPCTGVTAIASSPLVLLMWMMLARVQRVLAYNPCVATECQRPHAHAYACNRYGHKHTAGAEGALRPAAHSASVPLGVASAKGSYSLACTHTHLEPSGSAPCLHSTQRQRQLVETTRRHSWQAWM